MSDQYIYCFKTNFPTYLKNEHSNYGVYKIGKTSRDFHVRMKEHEKYFIPPVLFLRSVYDCDTIEKHLIKKCNDKFLKNKNGYEFFEARYSDIIPILEEVTSEDFQCNNIMKMDEDLICEICGNKYKSKQGLKQHITKIHKK
tara:strand:- start:8460 stop:8885 length:426 start_codon:yes stop_codon:yes gene_type:complete